MSDKIQIKTLNGYQLADSEARAAAGKNTEDIVRLSEEIGEQIDSIKNDMYVAEGEDIIPSSEISGYMLNLNGVRESSGTRKIVIYDVIPESILRFTLCGHTNTLPVISFNLVQKCRRMEMIIRTLLAKLWEAL